MMNVYTRLSRQGRVGLGVLAALLCTCAGAWAGDTSIKEASSAQSAYERVKAEPGHWNQMCGSLLFFGLGPSELPEFELYTFNRMDAHNFISKENFLLLRDHRDATITQIETELREAMATNAEGEAKQLDFSFQLAILIDLNAVEALDALLEWERQVHTMRKAEEMRAEVESNVTSGFGGGGRLTSSRTIGGFSETNAHRIVISTITAILREERYAPLLESPWERQFGEQLAKESEDGKRGGFDSALYGVSLRTHILDWKHNLPRAYGSTVKLTLDDTAINTVRAWAKNYLVTTPEDARRGAAGMHEWPIGM